MRHYCQDIPDWESKAIPMKLYGDGTPIVGVGKSWSKSADSYTWSSQVGLGRSSQAVFLIWGWSLSEGWCGTFLFDRLYGNAGHDSVEFGGVDLASSILISTIV
jgi:hypothetical protein